VKCPKSFIVLHHTGAEERDAMQVRRNHLRRGWRDVGYNYIIERNGLVVPGRSLQIPGAHCRASGMNFKSIGIALIGNLEVHEPAEQQVRSLVGLISWLQREHGISKESILPHNRVPGAKTLCPGRHFPFEQIMTQLGGSPLLWRVQVGAFKSREKAEEYANSLKKMGIDCFVVDPLTKLA